MALQFSDGGYPQVTNHTGEWSVNMESNTLEWSIETIDMDSPTGTLEFSSPAEDASAYFPVKVDFVSAESLCEVKVSF